MVDSVVSCMGFVVTCDDFFRLMSFVLVLDSLKLAHVHSHKDDHVDACYPMLLQKTMAAIACVRCKTVILSQLFISARAPLANSARSNISEPNPNTLAELS